jgi:hypothetical protein
MTVYGNFEATSQVFRTHQGAIWAARTAGTDETPDCCIKLMEMNQTMLEEGDTTVAQHLLVAAALQQAMGNKSEFWAPVYGLGSQGTNAFYVSRLYPRSAQTLIDHRTALNSSELQIILLGVVDALIDLQTAFHRSHANLKPSNVLISEASKIRPGGIVLCDPDASSDHQDSSTHPPDTKAVGELLYALVTHRPHATARWPLPQSDSWKELGSSSYQWRRLCENLLNTVSRRGMPTLEHLRDEIAAIRPTGRRIPRTAFAALALAAIAAVGYVKRDQLPALYHQTSAKVMAMLTSKPAPVSNHYAPATAPAAVAVVNTPPPIVSNPPVIPDPSKMASSPALLASAPAAPQPAPPIILTIPHVPPAPAPAVIPTPPPVVIAPSPRPDAEALKVVQTTASPEFHSDAAKAEFIHNQRAYIASHANVSSSDLLSDWAKILSKIQGIDSDYPPLDGSATPGWPTGLASVVNARRDAMLVRAIDAAFANQHADPSAFQATMLQVQAAAGAVVSAHDALARGDIAASEKAIAQCNIALKAFPPSDADLAELFGPSKKEFAALDEVAATRDRTTLLEIADNEAAPLAVRLAAWQHAATVSPEPWPAELPALAADQIRAEQLNTLLQEAGSVDIAKQVVATEAARQSEFFGRLRDQPSVLAAVKQANDPANSALLAKAPIWFRYDAALYALRTTLPAQLTAVQKQTYSELAGQVQASGGQLVHDVLKSAQEPPPSLAHCGPGSVKGWQLRGGWTRDHCTFVSTTSGDTLEFLHVHVADEPDGIDCYLCTTETPVALMQHLLQDDASAFAAVEKLNSSATPPKDGMRVWSFNDKAKSVDLDEDDYRKCFVVSPTDQLPLQFVTPQTAFYLSRRLGCRLPTAREWTAALNRAKNSTDATMKGFATMGWKVRDREFARLLTNPNRDAAYWPDDNIFLGDLDAVTLQRHQNAAVWSSAALASMGGSTPSENSGSPVLWPLSTLQTSTELGFRSVGDGENFAGVFHDLIGNVSEFVMDEPVVLAEKVTVIPPLAADEIVGRVSDWFSPEHLAAVSVIGGSALSPPGLDPARPYPLPKGAMSFADVGFRLAFTDPACLPNAQRAIIGQVTYLTAP